MISITIESSKFSTAPEGDLERCNGQPGSQLAEWLQQGMIERGYQCDEPMQEDYGWGYWTTVDGFTIWTAVSFIEENQHATMSRLGAGTQATWSVSFAYEAPFILFKPSLWFKKNVGLEKEEELLEATRKLIASTRDVVLIEVDSSSR